MADAILPANFQEALIPALPASGYYIPNFITPKEEANLTEKVFLNACEALLRILISYHRSTQSPFPLGSICPIDAFKRILHHSRPLTHSLPQTCLPGFQTL